jgi:hypothetical protein
MIKICVYEKFIHCDMRAWGVEFFVFDVGKAPWPRLCFKQEISRMGCSRLEAGSGSLLRVE